MKYLFVLLFALGSSTIAIGQVDSTQLIAQKDLEQIKVYEDTLQVLSYHVLRNKNKEERYFACQELIKTLVKTLKFDNSFYYSFDF